MASDQPASHGQPPKVAANLDVKLNTSPTSKPASQTSAFYHPFGQHNHSAMGDTYQTTFGANPLSIPNLTTSNTLDVHRHHSRLIALPASGSPDLKMDAAATYSPFNTFFASDLSAPTSPSGHAHSSLKQPSLASNSLKRKAGPSIASQMTQTPKQAKMDETMAGTELPGATPHSLQPVQASTLTPDEQPISGSPSNTVVSVKRNVGGRPKSAHAKPKKPTGPTRLRKNKPVEAAIHMDIWGLILPYCPLGFLFTAMKIDTRFQQSLKYESLWKDCRIQNYGADMPDPLPGMKEWDYAKLIEGLGCMGCDNKKTRKTYWAFQKRWCTKCLEKSTILESASSYMMRKHPNILQCIPHALFDSWGHYESAGNYDHTEWQRSGHGQQKGYELAAITKQLHEVEEFLSSGLDGKERTEEEIDAFYAPRIAANESLVKDIQTLEDWVEKYSREKIREAANQKADRENFYINLALSMSPPLQLTALERIPAYKRAITIPKAPSERSWQLLRPKLLEQRSVAEKLVEDEQERMDRVELNSKLSNEYTHIMVRRSTNDTPEQKLVLRLADEVLENLATEIPVHPVDEADFVLLVLRAVREKYERLGEEAKPDAKGGKYRLLLDDAKMIYEFKISSHIDGWKDPARSTAARMFKCPGCTRNDIGLRYMLIPLFCHLNDKHARQIGDFSILRGEPLQLPVGIRFPWCRLEWPRNLPVLAAHQRSTGRWDPNDNSQYVLAPQKPTSEPVAGSPFERRSVSTMDGPALRKFVDNIIYAAALLRPTSLAAKYQTQIALRFAVDRYALCTDDYPATEELEALDLARLRTGNYPLFDNFRCKACCDTPEPARNNKFVNKCQPFGELALHFKNIHFNLPWTSKMLTLPSETELLLTLTERGMECAMEVFNTLFPLVNEQMLDPTLRGGLRAPVANMVSRSHEQI